MRQYYCCGIEVQSTFDHFPGMHLSTVNRAGEERFMGNQLILVVQIQRPELFPLKCGHMQSQPFTDSV